MKNNNKRTDTNMIIGTSYLPDLKNATFLLFLVALLFLILINLSCIDDTKPFVIHPPQPQTLVLSREDSSATEVWLNLHIAPNTESGTIDILRDGKKIVATIVQQRTTLPVDTTIYDDSLLPNHSYTYQAYFQRGRKSFGYANTIKVTTMGTTGDNFVWTIDTIGNFSSLLLDVSIINDTCAYAVGEIYLNDSTGQPDPNVFDLAKWNGKKWNMSRLTNVPTRAVYGFSENDVWVGTTVPYHFDGSNWKSYNVRGILNGYSTRFWGSSSSDLFLVGTNGAIVHFDGTNWKTILSGTTLSFNDIWGAKNSRTRETEILAIASDKAGILGRKLLKINGETASPLPDSGLRPSVSALWFIPERHYYLVGDGFWTIPSYPWHRIQGTENFIYYSETIRGNGLNDIVIAGDYGDLLHFNGVTWKSYHQQIHINGIFHSVAIHNNLIIAVGEIYGYAIITIGKRQ